jgi:mannose-6-phosphate isomerase-like protein (cupin superfamily)
MSQTTLLTKREAMKRGPLHKCHGGQGALDFTVAFDSRENPGRQIRYIHDDILSPGVSIGEHPHKDEEHYLVLSGRGTMILDSQRHDIGPGDIASVYPGGTHGLENTGTEDLRVIVIAPVART